MPTVGSYVSGPLFDGRAEHEVQALLADVRREIGQQGLSLWQQNLDSSIRHPTPYYETQINLQEDPDRAIVNDRGIVYGPWLEGVGSRNRTTRFKGYFSLRRAVAELRSQVPRLTDAAVRRHVEAMNR